MVYNSLLSIHLYREKIMLPKNSLIVEVGESFLGKTKPTQKNNRRLVKVKCLCGKEKIVREDSLPELMSCGCSKYSSRTSKSLNHAKIIELYNNGLSIWKISQICKCSRRGVANILLKHNILQREYSGECLDSSTWRGYEELSKTYLSSIENGAISRNLDFKVTPEFLWNLFLQQNKKCALTGLEIKLGSRIKQQTASLDRIDSNKGYTEDNVQWVHKDINIMKSKYGQDYFIQMCKLVSSNF